MAVVEETEGGYRIRANVAEFRKEDIDMASLRSE
jgi:HSP20 family molecular chaperone IbpA